MGADEKRTSNPTGYKTPGINPGVRVRLKETNAVGATAIVDGWISSTVVRVVWENGHRSEVEAAKLIVWEVPTPRPSDVQDTARDRNALGCCFKEHALGEPCDVEGVVDYIISGAAYRTNEATHGLGGTCPQCGKPNLPSRGHCSDTCFKKTLLEPSPRPPGPCIGHEYANVCVHCGDPRPQEAPLARDVFAHEMSVEYPRNPRSAQSGDIDRDIELRQLAGALPTETTYGAVVRALREQRSDNPTFPEPLPSPLPEWLWIGRVVRCAYGAPTPFAGEAAITKHGHTCVLVKPYDGGDSVWLEPKHLTPSGTGKIAITTKAGREYVQGECLCIITAGCKEHGRDVDYPTRRVKIIAGAHVYEYGDIVAEDGDYVHVRLETTVVVPRDFVTDAHRSDSVTTPEKK